MQKTGTKLELEVQEITRLQFLRSIIRCLHHLRGMQVSKEVFPILKHMTKGSKRKTVLHSTSSSVKGPEFLLAIVHSCGLFLINIGEGTASLRVAVLPGIVEYLYDELDGVSDLMSPVQPLLTQAVTDDDHSKWNSKNQHMS